MFQSFFYLSVVIVSNNIQPLLRIRKYSVFLFGFQCELGYFETVLLVHVCRTRLTPWVDTMHISFYYFIYFDILCYSFTKTTI